MSRSNWFRGVVLGVVLLVAGVLLPAWSDTSKPKKYALLIGVNKYKRKPFTKLKYAENDATKLAEELRKAGFTVRLMTHAAGKTKADDAPTAANIRKALAEFVGDKTVKDILLLGMAGHGIEVTVPDPDDKGKPRTYPFFCPSDADLTNISYSTGRNKYLLNLNDMFADLGNCGAEVKLVLMDACRNELEVTSSTRGLVGKRLNAPRGVAALFACSPGEKAFESDKLRHGVFFHFVLKGLRGEAAWDGAVTFDDLVRYVGKKVTDEVPKLIRNGARQRPDRLINYPGTSPVLAFVKSTSPQATKDGSAKVVKQSRSNKVEKATNDLGMKFLVLPPGEFERGSADKDPRADKNEKPRHRVRLTRAFWLSASEVTQKEYKSVMEANPSANTNDDGPVTNVSWLEAIEFCNKLSRRLGYQLYYEVDGDKVTISGGDGYRLPTEAEWEYACRAGTTTVWSFGGEINDARNFGTFQGAAEAPSAVGKKKPNPWGFFDMHGNVWEWCWDTYEGVYEKTKGVVTDPAKGSKGKTQRLLRGGSFRESANEARSARRYSASANYRGDDIGIRVARTPLSQK